jgi:Replication-relaxation
MDSPSAHTPSRNSRWTRDPIVGNSGRPLVAQLTDRDIEILKLLARFRYLPADDIHAFVGGSVKNVTYRLNLLSRKPNLYINRPHQQRQNANTNSRPLIYELDDKGTAALRDRGLPHLAKSYHRNFAHELMACRIMASVELGARRNPAIRLITWPEILASDKTPLTTRNSPTSAAIPISFTSGATQHSINLTADARPFGLERANLDGTRSYFFFPGIEADCGTEPIETSDLDRSSISKKFLAYRAVAEQGLHRSHFGFPNFFVPVITTTTARMHSMMRLLEKITNGRGSKMFLFKTFPALASHERVSAPPGHMLTEPWQRVGFEPFGFTQ